MVSSQSVRSIRIPILVMILVAKVPLAGNKSNLLHTYRYRTLEPQKGLEIKAVVYSTGS